MRKEAFYICLFLEIIRMLLVLTKYLFSAITSITYLGICGFKSIRKFDSANQNNIYS